MLITIQIIAIFIVNLVSIMALDADEYQRLNFFLQTETGKKLIESLSTINVYLNRERTNEESVSALQQYKNFKEKYQTGNDLANLLRATIVEVFPHLPEEDRKGVLEKYGLQNELYVSNNFQNLQDNYRYDAEHENAMVFDRLIQILMQYKQALTTEDYNKLVNDPTLLCQKLILPETMLESSNSSTSFLNISLQDLEKTATVKLGNSTKLICSGVKTIHISSSAVYDSNGNVKHCREVNPKKQCQNMKKCTINFTRTCSQNYNTLQVTYLCLDQTKERLNKPLPPVPREHRPLPPLPIESHKEENIYANGIQNKRSKHLSGKTEYAQVGRPRGNRPLPGDDEVTYAQVGRPRGNRPLPADDEVTYAQVGRPRGNRPLPADDEVTYATVRKYNRRNPVEIIGELD